MELIRDGWTVCFKPFETIDGREFIPMIFCVQRADLKRFVEGFPDHWKYDANLDGYRGGEATGGVYCFRSDPKVHP